MGFSQQDVEVFHRPVGGVYLRVIGHLVAIICRTITAVGFIWMAIIDGTQQDGIRVYGCQIVQLRSDT